jgi:hypothetical protein
MNKEKLLKWNFLNFTAQKQTHSCNMYISMPDRKNTVLFGQDAFKIFCIYEN